MRVGFAELKMKLIGSIVAISGIQLLKQFMNVSNVPKEELMWLVIVHLTFVLSGMEAGVFALSRLRIRQQMRAGRPSARVLHHFLENPENFLWTILVGNTLSNLLVFGWLVKVLHDERPAIPVLVLTAKSLMEDFFRMVPVDGFLLKPASGKIVVENIRSILHRRGQRGIEATVRAGDRYGERPASAQ